MATVFTVIILLAATSHIRRSSGAKGRAISSILLLPLTALAVSISGEHKCDEGSVPPFVALATAVLAAGVPWVLRSRPWMMRGAAALVVLCGGIVESGLANSYHRDAITGNPSFASGRFWHTALTGQYPRDPGQTYDARARRSVTPVPTATTDGEPTAGASGVPAARP